MGHTEAGFSIVVEFVGLPGSGKSTVCERVKAILDEAGMRSSTTEDFVKWSASLGKPRKLWLLIQSPVRVLRHLLNGLRFWASLDRHTLASLRRVVLAPMIARSLERFLKSDSAPITLLDQADVQGIWSIGAHARSYDCKALSDFLRSSVADGFRLYVCLRADVAFASRNVAARTGGGSRFDALAAAKTREALLVAQPLMTEIHRWLDVRGNKVLMLDAEADVEQKASLIASQVRDLSQAAECDRLSL